MKRKMVVLLLAMALSLGTTACSDGGDVNESNPVGTEQSQSVETKESESKEGQGNEGQSGVTDEQSGNAGDDKQASAGQPKYLLSYGYEQGKLTFLNADGASVTEFDWPGLKEKCKAKGYDIDDATLDVMDGDTVYLHQYEDTEDYYHAVVYAVKLDTLDIKKVYVAEDGLSFDNLDLYDGKLYVNCSKYEDGKSLFREFVFEKDPADLQFREVKVDRQGLQDALESCTQFYRYSVTNLSNTQGCSLDRLFAEYGFVLGRKEDRLVKIAEDGLFSVVPGFEESSFYVTAYNADHVIFEKYDENWQSELVYLDLKSGESRYVERTSSADASIDFLALVGDKLYYREMVEKSFVLKDNQIFCLDLKNGNIQPLYHMESVPGAMSIEPGTQKFQIRDGKIYFQAVRDGELKWVCYEEDSKMMKAIATVEPISAFQYGTVVNEGYSTNCPSCGIPLESYYGEAFQLDQKYSAHADKINEDQIGRIKQMRADHEEAMAQVTVDDSECEEHKEYPQMYHETVEEYVSGVTILSEKYLVVDENGYWYGGGAHGQPYIWQSVYDLTTGEKKELKDFYQGSNEDFKKLVATKTQEDFNSYSEYMSPYFAEDEETVYNDAYEYADINASTVLFDKDGVTIAFEPYAMGPFASGYIEVRISYQELLGRNEL